MSAPSARPVLVWGEELEPTKPHIPRDLWDITAAGREGQDHWCALFAVDTVLVSLRVGENFSFCLINFVFSSSLLGTCTPPGAEHRVGGAGAACRGDPKSHLLTQHPCESCEWGKLHLHFSSFFSSFSLSQPKCSLSILEHVQMMMKAVGVWIQSFSHLTAPKAGFPPSPVFWVSKPLIPLKKILYLTLLRLFAGWGLFWWISSVWKGLCWKKLFKNMEPVHILAVKFFVLLWIGLPFLL